MDYTVQIIFNFCNRDVTKLIKMKRLTTMYYAQYASFTESEPNYDSDNSDTYKKLQQSPSHVEFLSFIQHRRDEKLLHKCWKQKLRENTNFANQVKEQCGMTVDLRANRVCYIYKPVTKNTSIEGIKFKITIVYVELLRKWYISLARSRVPKVIILQNKIKNGTYQPTGEKILKLVREWKNLLEIYTGKLLYIYQWIDDMKGTYKDIDFQLTESCTILKIMLKGKGWPVGVIKIDHDDVIILELVLNDNLNVVDLTYKYKCRQNMSREVETIHRRKLQEKCEKFINFDLLKAFDMFMKEKDFSYM
nr:uncharacterized protein LOC117218643 [Megalopta genalis]